MHSNAYSRLFRTPSLKLVLNEKMDGCSPPRDKAGDLLKKMEDQAVESLQFKAENNHSPRRHFSMPNNHVSLDPEWEVHSEEIEENRKKTLNERLNEIRVLKRLFEEQSRTINRLEQQQVNPTRNTIRPLQGENATLQRKPLSEYGVANASNGVMADFSKRPLTAPCDMIAGSSSPVRLEPAVTSINLKTFNHSTPAFVTSESDRDQVGEFDDDEDFFDDDSFNLDFDGTDSEIQAAISEIRKVASRTNVVMALNQLDTLQNELTIVSKELGERSAEGDDLRKKLEDSEARIASLELERDLFKADASKAKEDLQTCVERMYDISLVARGGSSLSNCEDPEGAPLTSQDVFRRKVNNPATTSSKPLGCKGSEEQGTPSVPNPDRLAPGYASGNTDTFTTIVKPVALQQLRQPQDRGLPSITEAIQTPEMTQKARTLVQRNGESIIESCREPDTGKIGKHQTLAGVAQRLRQQERGKKSDQYISIAPAERNRCQRLRTPSYTRQAQAGLVECSDKENRVRGFFRRKQQRSLPVSSCEADLALMRQQIDRLHEMMKSSVITAGHLRNRLAMVSRYYEGITSKLQERMSHMKNEKAKMEVDLLNQISTLEHDKRVAVIKLESTLRQRDDEITRLKGMDLRKTSVML